MIKAKKSLTLIILLFIIFGLWSCDGDGGGGGPTLVFIAVTPSNSSTTVAATKQFTATGAYSDGSTQDITTSVSWTSSDTTIAMINASGVATARATGTITITATLGGISAADTKLIVSAVALPKTGQTNCYNEAGNEISCLNTGQDGELRKGVGTILRFTVDETGECVKDNLTGLMWTNDANLAGPMTWEGALDYANGLSLCGHTDWYLPNSRELRSLIDYSQIEPALPPLGHPFINVQAAKYWSSTTYPSPGGMNLAWYFDMTDGWSDAIDKVAAIYVWPVRSEMLFASVNGNAALAALPKTGQTNCYNEAGNEISCLNTGQDGELRKGVGVILRFTDLGDGTIIDNLTGLMWLKDANCIATTYPSFDNDTTAGDGMVSVAGDGLVTWKHALDFVAGINSGTYSDCSAGYTDWRLPNINELESLIDYSKINPALPSDHPFINVQVISYWSSTTYVGSTMGGSTNYAWLSFMFDGYLFPFKKTDANSVWPVRGGE